MAAELKLHAQKAGNGIVRLIAGGTLSYHTADGLERELQRWFAQECNTVALDLGGIEALSSAGAAMLVGLARVAQERGGKIFLARPSAAVSRTLETMDLLPLFHVVADAKEALAK
ncbi:MAG: STAS domain-containing protein [Planctomycetes bacterium]|nr:STAS domain-containing protein [Planctomycetota bacterium]